MNLAEISKLSPANQKAVMADQARAAAARERIMAQVNKPLPLCIDYSLSAAQSKQWGHSPAPAAKSPKNPVSASMAGILPQCPGVKTKGPKVSESRLQQEVVKWWKLNCYEWQLDEELLMAIPNAGKRSPRTGARFVAEGLQMGAPDLFAAVPRGDCAGLFIEMKSRDGVLRESQRLMLARLTKVGYATVVCRSVEEATAAIRCYLNLPTPTRK